MSKTLVITLFKKENKFTSKVRRTSTQKPKAV